MTISSKVRNIPLSQLVLSTANVRSTPATAAEDAALEASIRAKGILQNLIVHSAGDDRFEVDAGGPRPESSAIAVSVSRWRILCGAM
jgi:ParB family chromosome partitioning protein